MPCLCFSRPGPFPPDPREGVARVSLEVPFSQVELWWPNGYGPQTLYQMTVSFTPYGGEESRVEQQVAFRCISSTDISPCGPT